MQLRLMIYYVAMSNFSLKISNKTGRKNKNLAVYEHLRFADTAFGPHFQHFRQ